MPLFVEVISSERTFIRISLMVTLAIETFEQVRGEFALLGL